jgi:hypothetical protein
MTDDTSKDRPAVTTNTMRRLMGFIQCPQHQGPLDESGYVSCVTCGVRWNANAGQPDNAGNAVIRAVARLNTWINRACETIREAVENEDGIDGAEATRLLRDVGYWAEPQGQKAEAHAEDVKVRPFMTRDELQDLVDRSVAAAFARHVQQQGEDLIVDVKSGADLVNLLETDQPATAKKPVNLDAAREAITTFRDHARNHGMDFRQRDPLVGILHDALNELERVRREKVHAERIEWRNEKLAPLAGNDEIGKAWQAINAIAQEDQNRLGLYPAMSLGDAVKAVTLAYLKASERKTDEEVVKELVAIRRVVYEASDKSTEEYDSQASTLENVRKAVDRMQRTKTERDAAALKALQTARALIAATSTSFGERFAEGFITGRSRALGIIDTVASSYGSSMRMDLPDAEGKTPPSSAVTPEPKSTRDALKLCLEALQRHASWCGYRRGSSGDTIYHEAYNAAVLALSNETSEDADVQPSAEWFALWLWQTISEMPASKHILAGCWDDDERAARSLPVNVDTLTKACAIVLSLAGKEEPPPANGRKPTVESRAVAVKCSDCNGPMLRYGRDDDWTTFLYRCEKCRHGVAVLLSEDAYTVNSLIGDLAKCYLAAGSLRSEGSSDESLAGHAIDAVEQLAKRFASKEAVVKDLVARLAHVNREVARWREQARKFEETANYKEPGTEDQIRLAAMAKALNVCAETLMSTERSEAPGPVSVEVPIVGFDHVETCIPEPSCRCCECQGKHCMIPHEGHSHRDERRAKNPVVYSNTSATRPFSIPKVEGKPCHSTTKVEIGEGLKGHISLLGSVWVHGYFKETGIAEYFVISSSNIDADPDRCAVCGWPLAETANDGCVRGNCSMRPRPKMLYDTERAVRETSELMRSAGEEAKS